MEIETSFLHGKCVSDDETRKYLRENWPTEC